MSSVVRAAKEQPSGECRRTVVRPQPGSVDPAGRAAPRRFLAIAWLAAAPRHRTALLANLGIGIVLGLVTVLGFFEGLGMLGRSGLADPDNFLHLTTATLALLRFRGRGDLRRSGFTAKISRVCE